MEGHDTSSSHDRWLGRVRERVVPICETCVTATDVAGAAVALVSSAGVRAVVYASDDASTALEAMQIDLAEGPSVDASRGPSPVLVGDLRDPPEDIAGRWPFFLPQADALGVRGVFAFPVRIGGIVLGTLELYRTEAGRLRGRQLSMAMQAASDMGTAIIDIGWPTEGFADTGTIDAGLLGRSAASVHQAAGMVMVQSDSTIDEAMAQLRASAFAEGRSLITLSAEVVSGHRRFRKEQL